VKRTLTPFCLAALTPTTTMRIAPGVSAQVRGHFVEHGDDGTAFGYHGAPTQGIDPAF
jgi:hypothetical protein